MKINALSKRNKKEFVARLGKTKICEKNVCDRQSGAAHTTLIVAVLMREG
jgi:hypothetical protein